MSDVDVTTLFDDIASDQLATSETSKKREANATEHPCEHCAGTGKWRGGTNRHGSKVCFACNGKGFFKSSAADRQKARFQRREREDRKREKNIEEFDKEFPGVRAFLIQASGWSQFAASMHESISKWGGLSQKQFGAVNKMMAKAAERTQEREASFVDIDATRIREMFDHALEKGKKRRALLAAAFEGDKVVGELKLTPASPNGKNPDAIWVRADGDFVGGIMGDGKFKPRRDAPAWVADTIQKVASDPEGQARLFGQVTGVCCCCGRELTDKHSIEAGIGPICAGNWGL